MFTVAAARSDDDNSAYVMYFRFCGWCVMFSRNGPYGVWSCIIDIGIQSNFQRSRQEAARYFVVVYSGRELFLYFIVYVQWNIVVAP